MQSCELVTFVSALACAIAKMATPEEVELYAAVFAQLGDTLATISVHNGICSQDADDQVTVSAKESNAERTEDRDGSESIV